LPKRFSFVPKQGVQLLVGYSTLSNIPPKRRQDFVKGSCGQSAFEQFLGEGGNILACLGRSGKQSPLNLW